MYTTISVTRGRRVAVLYDGVFDRVYGPGRATLWTGFRQVELIKFERTVTAQRIEDGDPLPTDVDGATVVEVGATQRVLTRVHGIVRDVLGPGRYRLWDDECAVEFLRFDILAEPAPLADTDRLPVIIGSQWSEVAAGPSTAQILYFDGVPVRRLTDGRYRTWRGGPWTFAAVDLGLVPIELAAQDLLTRDQVGVRVKPQVTTRVTDPLRAVAEPKGRDLVYAAAQLALREIVAARTLDELVEDRDALSRDFLQRTREAVPEVGLVVESAFVKDVVLPGDVKDLVNKVTLARKEAEALAIRRREEVAATRQLANTARLLAESPILMRLKELEATSEALRKVDKLVVVGSPTDLSRLLKLGDEAD